MTVSAHALASFPWEAEEPDAVPEIQIHEIPANGTPATARDSEPAEDRLADCLFRARELLPSEPLFEDEDENLFPTQLVAVDALLGGGIQRGETVEIIGWRTSGRFSLVLSTLAAATRCGESAALVDLGDHLDPQAAARADIDLERLLWLRPQHVKQALGGAEMLLATGFPLVILDLGAPPVPGGRGTEAAWLRLARAAQTHRGALLVSTPYRASGTAAQAVLEMRPWRRSGLWLGQGRQPRLLAGLEAELELKKSRGRLQLRRRPSARLRRRTPGGGGWESGERDTPQRCLRLLMAETLTSPAAGSAKPSTGFSTAFSSTGLSADSPGGFSTGLFEVSSRRSPVENSAEKSALTPPPPLLPPLPEGEGATTRATQQGPVENKLSGLQRAG